MVTLICSECLFELEATSEHDAHTGEEKLYIFPCEHCRISKAKNEGDKPEKAGG